MYIIDQIDYHYYHQLTAQLNKLEKTGIEVVQIIEIGPSGNTILMHRATILFRDVLKKTK